MWYKKYFPDFIFGAIDGLVTTFAVVAGVIGASLSTTIILILGFSNLFADGFSMAASNYLSSRSEDDLQYNPTGKVARTAALMTFLAFVIVGLVPLLAFVFDLGKYSFIVSSILTSIAFLVVGYIKGQITNKDKILNSIETFIIGASAAIIAYIAGSILSQL